MTVNRLLSWSARSNLVNSHFAYEHCSCYLSTLILEKYVIIKSQIERADGVERAREEVLFHRTARREEKRKEEGETAAVIR